MRKITLVLTVLTVGLTAYAQQNFTTVFESSNGLETATYSQTIEYYENLAKAYKTIHIQTVGKTDSGKPLHLITLHHSEKFDYENLRKNNQILLVNNGIHPGESDGIDATMMLFRDIAQGKIDMPKQTVLATIPIYNVGGSLNRNSTTRTNQNGPKSYGFRGNARNFDLNRDFIKSDTKNANAFAQIYHLVQPDVFIDNHVSNGADYQYILTHLFTQHNKLGGDLGNYLHEQMMPKLEKNLAAKKWDITPYVNVFNSVPEKGFSQFMDSPRYSTGYTTLFNTLGMMVETHMLKPYKQRVNGTYELMKSMLDIVEKDGEQIAALRKNAWRDLYAKKAYSLAWKVDTSKSSTLSFKGFEGEMITSNVTGGQRLKYDPSKPFTKTVKYSNYFKPTITVQIPKAYIIPQGWHKVINLLKLNKIDMHQLQKDEIRTVEVYNIIDHQTRPQAYEGHYIHRRTNVKSSVKEVQFREGDYYISTEQPGFRYLMETLEPQGPDSFFSWNFFDTILQQKEGFSPYVWEDQAEKLLANNSDLKKEFENKKASDDKFAKSWYAQLNWLHKSSDNYEKAHMVYPVYRVVAE